MPASRARCNTAPATAASAASSPEQRRVDALHARFNLQSAGSGSFASAAGALVDFLREVGSEPDSLGFF